MEFVNLHLHDEYSLIDGYGHPYQFVERAKVLNMKALAETNHGSISGHFRFYTACKKADIKPILGCEMYIVKDYTNKTARGYNHVTILVKNLEGYKNLTKLISISYEKGFYYKPRIDWNLLEQYKNGLIILSGCSKGILGKMASENKSSQNIANEMLRLNKIFDNFYIELMPWSYEEGKKIARAIYEANKIAKLPMVLTMDCHYPNPEDEEIQDILLCIQTHTKIDTSDRMKFDQKDFYLKDGEKMKLDWEKNYPDLPFKEEMLSNTVKIADSIDFEFPKAKSIEYSFEGNKIEYIKKLCWNGMKIRGLDKKPEYIDRIKREFKLVVQKNYVDYFLVIIDLINWAKKNGIFVGPARGSSCGSLFCYVTKITEIDPLKFGLLFERFIDINRTDLPDIDIDFEDEKREDVKKYLENKYGKDKVASLATFGTFQGRLSLQDIGRVFNIKGSIIDEVKKLVVQRSGGDSRFTHTVEDTFTSFEKAADILKEYPVLKFAKNLEGQIRQLGVHAAGVIVSNEPINNFAAFYRSTNEQKVISMDYYDASAIGLLKIDLLGLSTLTVIKNTLEMIKKRYGHSIDLYNLPLDDKKTLKGFKEGKLFGVFQFDGQAMMQVCRQVKPENFGHLADINALSRPGPLHSRSTTDYIERKNGKQKITYLHPIIKNVTKDTFGVAIYQEQVMQIVRQIGKFSWKDTSTIRQTMSKSRGVESFNKFRKQFIAGAKENGIEEKLADTIWNQIYTFGSWAFNKCISGDTVLMNTNPNQFAPTTLTAKELFENNGYATSKWKYQPENYKKLNTLGMDTDGRIRPSRVKNIFYKGLQDIYELKTKTGKTIKITNNHKLLGKNGFKELYQFKVGEKIALNAGYESKKYISTKLGKGWRKGRKGGAGDYKDFRTKEIKNFSELHKNDACQHCEYYKDRMEVHHVTKNAPNSILEWLCSGCHKIAEYKKGRTKTWQKGFAIKFDTVKSIKYKGKENVYDIEMEDSSKPSFIANDFVSHNSHSVSYSVISYWTMYLKMHYPLEFYLSLMCKENRDDKLRKVIKEYKSEGGKFLPIDINKSKISFSLDEDGIRVGFTQILGIGEKMAEQIVANQPYQGIIDFKEKTGLKKSVDILLKVGAFKELKIIQTQAQSSLFQKSIEEELGFDYKNPPIQYLAEYCPMLISENIREKWLEFCETNLKESPITIKSLSIIEEQTKVTIIGRTDPKKHYNPKNRLEETQSRGLSIDDFILCQSKFRKIDAGELTECIFCKKKFNHDTSPKCSAFNVKNYDFLNFDLEDETDYITVRIPFKIYNKFFDMMWNVKPDEVLMVQGMVNGGIRMVFANNVINLSRLKLKLENNQEITNQEKNIIKILPRKVKVQEWE